MPREDDRVDEVLGEPDREEAHRDQDDAEERVDGAEVRPRRPVLDREPEHEVRAVEEKEDEEEHELVLAPEPPVAPRDLRPDRARQERERAEDDAEVNRHVALEVGAGPPLPEMEEGLPAAPAEADVGGQRDRDVEVEDSLREALIGVVGDDEEDERDARGHERERCGGERRQPAIP